MIKLNGDDVQVAWEDYKEFMASMGADFKPDHPGRAAWLRQVEQAFKFAYAMGKASKGEVAAAPIAPPIKSLDQVIADVEDQKNGPRYKRRSDKQIEQDARLVASILQRNGGEMRLMDITTAVNAAGGDWYEKSASGHMSKVMERIPAIKKVGYGLYKYEQ